jgi:hypothetical protein
MDRMDAKPHYFKIGLFVLVAVAMIVAGLVLFGAGFLDRDVLHLESYFADSITGLNVGSPLEFRGVRIGQVEQIGFVGSVYELYAGPDVISPYAPYVRVVTTMRREKLPELDTEQLEMALTQMTEKGLRVRVSSNLLTGQAFLEMDYLDPNRFPVESIPWDPVYLRIPSAPSELTTIKDSVDSILRELKAIDVAGLADSLEAVFNSLESAITEANLAELSAETLAFIRQARQKVAALEMEEINASVRHLLHSLDGAVEDANVPALASETQALMAELRSTNAHLQALLGPSAGLAKQPNVPEILDGLERTVSDLNRLIVSERPEISEILTQLRVATAALRPLIDSLRDQPSELLFGDPPPRSEVLE